MIIRVHDMGKDAGGLTRYLFGPGKANEHTNQRLVAGSTELHAEWSGGPLTSRDATHLGRMVEMSWRRQYVPELALAGQAATGISRANLAGGEGAVAGQAHVFHASLSLHKDEGTYTDEQWQKVAEEYVRGMGFIDDPQHPDASWYAVNHGLSGEGNDHIHIVVCTTRRDGSTIDTNNTGLRSQQVRRDVLEHLDFVTPLHDRARPQNAPSIKGYTAAEHNIAKGRAAEGKGSSTPDRVQLQRIVRAAAAQATTEAAFINAVLAHPGVQLEAARWEPGGRDVVTGYKVALNGGATFPASQLAADLTLSKLRTNWTETPESRDLARELWNGDATKLDPLTATRDAPAQLDQAAAHLERFNTDLEQLDPHDKQAWDHALVSLSGTTTVLATGRPAAVGNDGRPTGFGPDAGRAADALARQALADTWNRPPAAAPQIPIPRGLNGAELATRHVQLALRAGGTHQHRGWLVVVQQINRAADAIRQAKEARRELHSAQALSRDVNTSLTRLEAYLNTTITTDVPPPPAGESAPFERTSERLLREQVDRERERTAPAAEPMTAAARAAKEAADHGRTGAASASTAPVVPGSPATPTHAEKDTEQKRGRGPKR